MSEREDLQTDGIPRLLDQYKQRRQAWLAQADELVRLRDEARLAAEREAMEIVTAARRDVRRIVVQARRELLVLTAQLHAAVDAVEPLQLDRGAASMTARHAQLPDALVAADAFQPTREVVLDARREVRSVLDEARAEIEALAADASVPLLSVGQPAARDGGTDGPIPTLDAILGEVARSADAALRGDRLAAGQWRIEGDRPELSATPPEPIVDVASAVSEDDRPRVDRTVGRVASVSAFRDFQGAEPETDLPSPSEFETSAADDEASRSTTHDFAEPRVFLASDDSTRSGTARVWLAAFAAVGVLAIGGAWWLLNARRGQSLASRAAAGATASAVSPSTGTTAAASQPAAAAAKAPEAPAGLAVEVRRTAWIQTVVDGKEESRVYKAGETRQIIGARNVSIRAGDAGAVFVSVDGRSAEPLGPSGTAVTRQYSLKSGAVVVPAVATAPSSRPTATGVVAQVASTGSRPAAPLPSAAARPDSDNRAGSPAASTVAQPPPAAPGTDAAPASPAGGDATAGTTGGSRGDLVAGGQQWLDAYQRRDRDGMGAHGTESTSISDERSVTERFPAWQQGVRRELDQVELELTGDTALLTARMVERGGDAPAAAQHVSRVSQIWVRRNGRWRIADVRIIGEGRLSQIVR